MTFAMKPTDVQALIAERFGEEIEPFGVEPAAADQTGPRARFIATMHALIAWLLAHPEVPAPWVCSIGVVVRDPATLVQLSESFGVQPWSEEGVANHATLFHPLDDGEFYTPISISVDAERAL